VREVDVAVRRPWWLVVRYGYHFVSLGVIVAFLALGIPPFRAVVYATCCAAAFGLIEMLVAGHGPVTHRLGRYGVTLYESLAAGVRSVLPVAAVCTAAGIVVSTITKTGLGQELANLLVTAARAITSNETAVLVMTVVLAAVAISLLGLAVPVTASFIISWVIIGPALVGLGVPAPATAMFIFYYAVLSEVTPPTALAAVASAAITGGRVIQSMVEALRYSLPAFLVPMAFVLTSNGSFLLWQGTVWQGVWTFAVSAVAVIATAVVTGGWLAGPARWPERALCAAGALALLYLEPAAMIAGACLLAAAAAVHLVLRSRSESVPGKELHHGQTRQ